MADKESFPVGQAPWEQGESIEHPDSFPVGKAPWETQGPSLGDRATAMAKKVVDMGLPAAGMAAGAAVAAPANIVAPGVAEVGGAGLGYAAGKQLARILDQHIFGETPESVGVIGALKRTAKETGEGAAYEMAGQYLAAVPDEVKSLRDSMKAGAENVSTAAKEGVSSGISYNPVENKDQIEAAAKGIGIDSVPKAVLTDNPTFQKLESGLSQSGSFPAGPIRTQYNDFFKGVDEAGNKIADLKTPQSEFSLGKSIQDDLASQVVQKQAPVNDLYKNITPDLQKIPVDQESVNRAIGSLKSNPIFQTKDGVEALEDAKNVISQQPELNSLKEYRSSIYDSVDASKPINEKRADAIYEAITKIRDRSITAMKGQLPPEMHPEVDDLIDKVALADKSHASNLEDLNNIRAIIGGKPVGSQSQFMSKLSNLKEADLAQRAANLDVSSLEDLKQTFPSVFDKVQAAKINDMVQNSTDTIGGFNVNRFMKQYNVMDQEAKDLIFAPEIQQHIENLQTVRKAIPEKLGPSGTPEGMMLMERFDPHRNIYDYGIKKALDFSSAPKPPPSASAEIAETTQPSEIGKIIAMAPKKAATNPQNLPAAAQQDAPQKGPEKWANDGFQALLQHADTAQKKQILQELKQKIMRDPRGKELLGAASDLRPGSKAMENIFNQLQDKYGGKE